MVGSCILAVVCVVRYYYLERYMYFIRVLYRAICGHTCGFSLDWNVLIFFFMYVGICLPSGFRTAAVLAESERGEDWSGCYGVVELNVRKIQAMG